MSMIAGIVFIRTDRHYDDKHYEVEIWIVKLNEGVVANGLQEE